MDAPALRTDLYQLTMLQAYFDQGMEDVAVFELAHSFVWRAKWMAAGLDSRRSRHAHP